ncbi:MAG: hypothetical protein WC677_02745 [Clostridia bacterium]|jgi:hypothetical protein
MKSSELLVSNLSISEDSYDYRGIFTLSCFEITMTIELSDMDSEETIEEIKEKFSLDEEIATIRKTLMDKVISHSGLSSRNNEGENYNDSTKKKELEKEAKSLDMA